MRLAAFRLLPTGFDNRQLRTQLAPLLGVAMEAWSPGRMSYDLRRLRHDARPHCLNHAAGWQA